MNPPPRRLVCAGSVVVDIVMKVPGLPEPGGDIIARSAKVAVGGALNVMAAARNQGMSVAYAGGHGTGPFGEIVRSALKERGIEVIAPAATGRDTGFSITLVTTDGERTFATAPGAEATLTLEALDSVAVTPADFVYVSGYGLAYPDSGSALAGWLSHLDTGVTVVVDPGPLVADIPRRLLYDVAARCNWWTCNEREARLITGAASPHDSIRGIAEFAGRDGVLVRLGPNGCLLLVRGRDIQHFPGQPVDVSDTTGAGDAHTGTFMAVLANGVKPSEAVRMANVAAGLAVSRDSPGTHPLRSNCGRALAGDS